MVCGVHSRGLSDLLRVLCCDFGQDYCGSGDLVKIIVILGRILMILMILLGFLRFWVAFL